MRAIITIGISASGKSTFAAEWIRMQSNRIEINRDSIRKELVEKDGKVWSWKNWSWKREDEVTDIVVGLISYAKSNGKNIIVSDTNLSEKTRTGLVSRLQAHGYDVEIKEFPIDIETAWKRDAARLNGVGHSVIAKQYEEWIAYKGYEKHYVALDTLPKAWIFDVDGTLASMDGKRGPFEWDKVGGDSVNEYVKIIANSLPSDVTVIVLSGRDGCCYDLTKEWLKKNDIRFDHLWMRVEGDMRKDAVIKSEIFWSKIADNYNVVCAVDDRPVMIRNWLEMGVKTLACGNQQIEF